MSKKPIFGLHMLSSQSFLDELISEGADASSNLFLVSFTLQGVEEDLHVRSTRVVLPKKENRNVIVPFQNVDFPIMSPGASVDRSVSVDIRIDDNYKHLATLENLLCVDDNGFFHRDESKSFTCTVNAYRPSDLFKGCYEAVNSYKFHDCYLLELPSLTYSYESSSTVNPSITFMFSTYEHLETLGNGSSSLISMGLPPTY